VSSTDAAGIELQWGIQVPLRDGIHLNATVYLPNKQPAPSPCIFTLTPYIADTYHELAVFFASRGLPFIIVDVRGRGNSQGVFRPFLQEAEDGYDLVEWVASQPYCNGKVAMSGGSYGGYSQWATAKGLPPHLTTIVPTAAPYIGVDFPMRNNIFYPYLVQWLLFTSGRALQTKIFSDSVFWSMIYCRWHESGRAFRDVDAVFGSRSEVFQEWLTHPEPSAYWDAYNPTADHYAHLQLPILTITGSYDDDQPGALEHYKMHMRNGLPAARARHYLIIGPWDHAGTRTPQAEFGGLTFEAQSVIDMRKLHLEWYGWTMQGLARPQFLKRAVAYYVMGAERWRYADTLEEITAHYETYFLESDGNSSDVFSAGALGIVRGWGRPDTYIYDPRDARGPEVEAEARSNGGSLVDQTVTLALRGKCAVYHTAPFAEDLEVSGFFRLSAWIEIDAPDTDFYASVYEIDSDGRSIRLSTDALRARYREGLRTPKLIGNREPLRYDFERFTFTSRLVRRGHRLRLVVAPTGRLIESIFAEKNYNGGGIVAEETVADGRPVTVSVYHDDGRPSALYVPVGRAECSEC
jgi:putative CocE/NonD family hydrolase